MKLVLRIAPLALAFFGLSLQAQNNSAESDQFQFRTPQRNTYRLIGDEKKRALADEKITRVNTVAVDGATNIVAFCDRIVVQLESAYDLKQVISGHELELLRTVNSNIFILQARDALAAMHEAHRLAVLPGVLASYPVMERQMDLNGVYAPRSNDPFAIPFFNTTGGQTIGAQWPIENRDGFSTRLGIDLNVMAAWPYGSGQGITVAVADSGLELTHPELAPRVAGAPHFNFDFQTTNAVPFGGGQSDPLRDFWTHGTSVAGLIAAEGNNGRGMIGVAPKVTLASWLIFKTNGFLVADDQLMDMFQYKSNIVSVQNHSWGAGNGLRQQDGPTLLEQVGIANAVTLGRNGRGEVLIRAAGNDRSISASANDDGYTDDPQQITVAAVRKNGRVTSYSEAGSTVLVGAPGGGDDDPQGLFTLDLVGFERGVNSGIFQFGDLPDYRFGVQGFAGTSAAAPLVAGVVADILSANTNLSYRDVQQILALCSRHADFTDPDIVTNGAGFLVSHNLGFGIPDAGYGAQLAKLWTNRPPLVTLTMTDTVALPIPDDGLRVEVTGNDIPASLASIHSFPTLAPGGDDPTAALQLVDIGLATNVPALNLTNKGALILRGEIGFDTKIFNAAKAGASFAIIYNSTNGGSFNLGLVSTTDFSPIPAVFIGNSSGEALKAVFQTNNSALARIHLLTADKTFHVNSTLLCEQVGVRVQTDHPLRGDLRITLRSPQGTRSVLQHFNDDTSAGPTDWTYWTTHDFFESSAGDWTVSFSDEFAGAVGSVRGVSLIIRGTQIADFDHDGLDDNWEATNLASFAFGPKDDPDGDGLSNAREQLMGTNPLVSDLQKTPDISRWGLFGSQLVRISWPGTPKYNYEVRGGTNLTSMTVISNVPGAFPETVVFAPYSASQPGFFKIQPSLAP